MTHSFRKTTLSSVISTLALTPILFGASSAGAQQEARILEEIIVTAQKREQNIQDVGIAITAFSGDQMNALGMTNTTEIIQQVPGLDVVAWSPTLTSPEREQTISTAPTPPTTRSSSSRSILPPLRPPPATCVSGSRSTRRPRVGAWPTRAIIRPSWRHCWPLCSYR